MISTIKNNWSLDRILEKSKKYLKLPISHQKYEALLAERDRLLAINTNMSEVLDAGFFRLDFNKYKTFEVNESTDGQAIQRLANQWDSLFKQGKYEELMNELISTIKIRIAHPNSQDYFGAYAEYYLACFFAAIKDADKAAHYASMIRFGAPPDGADFLPYDIRKATQLSVYRQQAAIDRGMPAILLIALPKSASAFLSDTFSKILKVPVLRITVGEGFESYPVPQWVKQVIRGGVVTHEHMEGTFDNLKTLSSAGVENIWVQIRDPRDAAYSYIKSNYSKLENNPLDFVKLSSQFANWIDRWQTALSSNMTGIGIRFISYQQVTNDITNTIKTILDGKITDAIEQSLSEHIKNLKNGASIPNFRKGVADDWRSAHDQKAQQKVWLDIPDSVKDLLELQP